MRRKCIKIIKIVIGTLLFLSSFSFSQYNSAAVYLPNGNIMMCGGIIYESTVTAQCTITISSHITTASSTNMFITTNLNTARANHTMTLLPDGRVLVAGGYTAISFHNPPNPSYPQTNYTTAPYQNHFPRKLISTGTTTNSAEICLSSSPYNCFSTSNMTSPRAGHTAVLLTTGPHAGNVLICGGQTTGNNVTNSCEIFITTTNQFVNAPSMISPRFGHTASLLPNGKILMSGGISFLGNPSTYTLTQELYDPISNSFTPSPEPLFRGKAFHSSVVLNNGNVLIFGGYNEYNDDDKHSKDEDIIKKANLGEGTWGFLDEVEMFNKNAARVPVELQEYTFLPYRVTNAFSVLKPDGSVLLVGGRGNIPVTYFPSRTITTDKNLTTYTTSMAASELQATQSDFELKKIITRVLQGPIYGIISFKEKQKLSREVAGKIVNGDIFYSPPDDPAQPSIQIGNLKIFLGHTTAQLDNSIIGYFDENEKKYVRELDTELTLSTSPLQWNGTIYFDPIMVTNFNNPRLLNIDLSTIPTLTGNIIEASSSTDISDFFPEGCSSCTIYVSSITLSLPEGFPAIYPPGTKALGRLSLIGASLQSENCSLTISQGYTNLDLAQDVTGYFSDYGRIELTTPVTFYGLLGLVQNTSDQALTLNSNDCLGGGLRFVQGTMTMYFSLYTDTVSYTPPADEPLTINFGISTAVIRDMIFGDGGEITPSNWKWTPLKFFPLVENKATGRFDSLGIITISGVPQIFVWGRGCDHKNKECKRNNPIFRSRTTRSYLIEDRGCSWLEMGSLKVKRANHTATVLSDGNILVCGGTNGPATLSSCEIYNKYKDEWVMISSMTEARSYHTATLLPNGTVLITGGVQGDIDKSQALNTAEIYFPLTRSFVKVGNMNSQRAAHTATLLPNGNVLITGGVSSGTYRNDAEIFITTANIFVPVSGNIGSARAKHSSILMKDGRVIIVGGYNATNTLNDCRIFNTSNNLFSPCNPINYARHSHTTHLMDDGRVFIFGGRNDKYTINKAEVFDGTNWYVLGDGSNEKAIIEVSNHSSLLLPSKRIIFTGGEQKSFDHENNSDNWISSTAFNFYTEFYSDEPLQIFGNIQKRVFHKSVLLEDNNIAVIGGWDGKEYIDSVKKRYYLWNEPDSSGLESQIPRKPYISSVTFSSFPEGFDRGDYITIISTYYNLHDVSQA